MLTEGFCQHLFEIFFDLPPQNALFRGVILGPPQKQLSAPRNFPERKSVMRQLEINGKSSYTVTVGANILSAAGDTARALTDAKRVLLVSDFDTASLYADQAELSFAEAGFRVFRHVYSNSQGVKSLDTVTEILSTACSVGLTRRDLFVALGGGTCHDLTGIAAALYRRGTRLFSIPTSLTAQADACIGGKASCDIFGFSDAAGVIKTPVAVTVDVSLLNTLPQKCFSNGMAEVIKTAALGNTPLFERLADEASYPDLESIVFECLKYKKSLIEDPERSSGMRRLLAFGSTLGLAMEKYYGASGISHGEAVSIGMVTVTDASERAGLTRPGTAERLSACLSAYSLPTYTTIPTETLAELVCTDFKNTEPFLEIPLIRDIGCGFIKRIRAENLADFLAFDKKTGD